KNMNNKYDVIISGACPSGNLLGYLLSSQGIEALVLEKERFPRFKVCAGGLQYRAAALIPFEIVEVIEKEIREAHTPLSGYRLLAVGDAAGLGDAFTGEGLYNGLFSSIMASESIIASLSKNNFSFEDYREKIADNIYEDIRISRAFSRLFSNFHW
ncbi:MAG: FAD-dependent monooxygenase, partial [Actinomycetota bacterium]